MHLYTKIRKRDLKSENGVEHTQTNSSRIVMERPSCDATDYKAVYATTQPMHEPPSALAGMEPTGSESGASGEMDSENYVAKKSINVCQFEMVR